MEGFVDWLENLFFWGSVVSQFLLTALVIFLVKGMKRISEQKRQTLIQLAWVSLPLMITVYFFLFYYS